MTEHKHKLIATHLGKSYRSRWVVVDVSMEVNTGEIVGLLGPNGAGKTTSFYMIVGLVRPNRGNVFLDGKMLQNYQFTGVRVKELAICHKRLPFLEN